MPTFTRLRHLTLTSGLPLSEDKNNCLLEPTCLPRYIVSLNLDDKASISCSQLVGALRKLTFLRSLTMPTPSEMDAAEIAAVLRSTIATDGGVRKLKVRWQYTGS